MKKLVSLLLALVLCSAPVFTACKGGGGPVDPGKTDIAPESGPFGRHREDLCRRMQLDRRQIHPQKSHILHDQTIHSGPTDIVRQPLRLLQFRLIQQRIHRSENPDSETMGIAAQPFDIRQRHTRIDTRTESRRADIERIGTTINCSTTTCVILNRS